jgi:uncharacterized membrane protein
VRGRWGTGRIEAFSDGVFAIAITLLVLDLGVPAWMAHHALFRCLRYADAMVMRLNLVVLMAVSFLPFPTGLMAEAIRNTGAERAAVVFYGATLLSISILLRVLWGALASRPDLLDPNVRPQDIRANLNAATPNIGFYAAVILLAVLVPKVAVFGYLVIAIAAVWRARGDNSPQPRAAEVA